jgi:hypothetical protein
MQQFIWRSLGMSRYFRKTFGLRTIDVAEPAAHAIRVFAKDGELMVKRGFRVALTPNE